MVPQVAAREQTELMMAAMVEIQFSPQLHLLVVVVEERVMQGQELQEDLVVAGLGVFLQQAALAILLRSARRRAMQEAMDYMGLQLLTVQAVAVLVPPEQQL